MASICLETPEEAEKPIPSSTPQSPSVTSSPMPPESVTSSGAPARPQSALNHPQNQNRIQNMYNDSKFSFLNTLPMEKVDRWLQCAEFVF
ncbi:Protein CBG11878 [Caenorhabditis briggsae]|uniref:Protein CBG11878 n=1 Tax=Caenorhabditis briggsae TaxID=6238 RepID=A8XE77_CAEBR|nr:Protein CBG11878 [Caenorhabditis briggsae]CAP30949.2 Protein CBG11878 [Caenorhabditis briggsae]